MLVELVGSFHCLPSGTGIDKVADGIGNTYGGFRRFLLCVHFWHLQNGKRVANVYVVAFFHSQLYYPAWELA